MIVGMKKAVTRLSALFVLFIGSCASAPPDLDITSTSTVESIQSPTQTQEAQAPTLMPNHTPTQETIPMTESVFADVLSVDVSGQANAYQFNVRVSSPDKGCDQYADWWEVLSEDGKLLYRRVLLHSHVSEQPFSRSGGPVEVDENAIVLVRAHMNIGGYGGAALRGSVSGGFESVQLETGFAADIEALPPLPEGCAF